MKKILFLTVFFASTPIFIFLLTFSLLSQSLTLKGQVSVSNPKIAFAALPSASAAIKSKVFALDGRVFLVKSFFKYYKSDLLPYADDVILAADKYGLDYRLVPAIAMQESNLCKKLPGKLKDSHNCWGYGVYGKNITRFSNYKDAIYQVTKTLTLQYKAGGLETPEQIMTKYTPGSNGSWANGVNHFMNELSANL